MPGRFERHRRTKWEWGTPGARSGETRAAAAADPDPAKRPPGRKDRRAWCKGKHGIEHAGAIILDARQAGWRSKNGCQWTPSWGIRLQEYGTHWLCEHREVCTRCGRILRESSQLAVEECPAYPGSGEQRAAAEVETAAREARRAASLSWRKPPVTGPQGYRRQRKTGSS